MDDFLATAIAIAATGVRDVCRQSPEAKDLVDRSVMLIDIGMQHNPEFNNLDHHQMERAGNGKCSVHLVLEKMGIDPAKFEAINPWLKTVGNIDCGEYPDRAGVVSNPIIQGVLRSFNKNGKIPEQVVKMMHMIGLEIMESYKATIEDIKVLETRIKDGVCDATDRKYSFAATNIVGTSPKVDFLLVNGREDGTINIMKKGNKELPEREYIFKHPSNFMAVIASKDIKSLYTKPQASFPD